MDTDKLLKLILEPVFRQEVPFEEGTKKLVEEFHKTDSRTVMLIECGFAYDYLKKKYENIFNAANAIHVLQVLDSVIPVIDKIRIEAVKMNSDKDANQRLESLLESDCNEKKRDCYKAKEIVYQTISQTIKNSKQSTQKSNFSTRRSSSSTRCEYCSGNGMIICPSCNGTGTVVVPGYGGPHFRGCPTCNMKREIMCRPCNGKGVR
ncbi:MAG: hypothetical protein R2852_10180 [Bacteroidia bacterium]